MCKINPHIGVSKKAVNAYDTNDGSKDAIEIPGRKPRNRNDDHQINKRSIQNILRGNPHEHAKNRPESKKRDRDEDVVQYGVCMQMSEFTGKKFWGGQETWTSFLLGAWEKLLRMPIRDPPTGVGPSLWDSILYFFLIEYGGMLRWC